MTLNLIRCTALALLLAAGPTVAAAQSLEQQIDGQPGDR